MSLSPSLHQAWLLIGNKTDRIHVTDLFADATDQDATSRRHILIMVGGGEFFDLSGIVKPPGTLIRGFGAQSANTSTPAVPVAVPLPPQVPVVPAPRPSVGAGIDMTHCLHLSAAHPDVNSYVDGNVTALSHNDTSMVITFNRLPGNESEISGIPKDEVAHLEVLPHCLGQRKRIAQVNFTFVKPPPPPEETELKKVIKGTAEAVSSIGAIPGVAVASARSGLVLTLVECEPDFYTTLGGSLNPSRMSIGDPKYGQFVSMAIMNHVFILGIGLAHFLLAVLYSFVYKVTIGQATSRARCPSLTIIPVLAFLEPTSMGATVTIIYGDTVGMKIVGVLSLMLCYGYCIGLFIYLRKTWVGIFIKGENPGLFIKPKKRTAITDDDDPEKNEAGHKTFGRRLCAWLGYFVDGGVKWKDKTEADKGYCRRNRLLFMDFTGDWYWFLTVELFVCVLCGTLDGVKLGIHQCNGIVITLIIILLAYFIFIMKTRPYNAPFLLIFSIILTGIQLAAAVFMGISMFGGGETWQDWAEFLTLIAFYIIIGRAFFDIAPKLKQMIVQAAKKCMKKKPKKSNNLDLTTQLLEAIQDDQNNVEMQINNNDGLNGSDASLELPEFEVDGDLDLDYEPVEIDMSDQYADLDRLHVQPPPGGGANTEGAGAGVWSGMGVGANGNPPTEAERRHKAEVFKILAEMAEHDEQLEAEKEAREDASESDEEILEKRASDPKRAEANRTAFVNELGDYQTVNAARAVEVQQQQNDDPRMALWNASPKKVLKVPNLPVNQTGDLVLDRILDDLDETAEAKANAVEDLTEEMLVNRAEKNINAVQQALNRDNTASPFAQPGVVSPGPPRRIVIPRPKVESAQEVAVRESKQAMSTLLDELEALTGPDDGPRKQDLLTDREDQEDCHSDDSDLPPPPPLPLPERRRVLIAPHSIDAPDDVPLVEL